MKRVERIRRGKQWAPHRHRWLCDVPLRGDAKAITVNWLEIEIADAKRSVTYRNSFITDLPVDRDNVAELAACGRARWKIENETFNVLKTKGYNLAHNFGHGKRHLASVLATLNLLAFAFHTICELSDRAWKGARRELVTRQGSSKPSWRSPLISCSPLGRRFLTAWLASDRCHKGHEHPAKHLHSLTAPSHRSPIENCWS
jgi:hypothetical protein